MGFFVGFDSYTDDPNSKPKLNILQCNIRGLLDQPHTKCNYIKNLMNKLNIDIVILQEWSATIKTSISKFNQYWAKDSNGHQIQKSIHFPTRPFEPDYNVYYHETETAIIYNNKLSVTEMPPPKYPNKARNRFLHYTTIVVHQKHQPDTEIVSFYRPHFADITNIFQYKPYCDHIIIGGDFNTCLLYTSDAADED